MDSVSTVSGLVTCAPFTGLVQVIVGAIASTANVVVVLVTGAAGGRVGTDVGEDLAGRGAVVAVGAAPFPTVVVVEDGIWAPRATGPPAVVTVVGAGFDAGGPANGADEAGGPAWGRRELTGEAGIHRCDDGHARRGGADGDEAAGFSGSGPRGVEDCSHLVGVGAGGNAGVTARGRRRRNGGAGRAPAGRAGLGVAPAKRCNQ